MMQRTYHFTALLFFLCSIFIFKSVFSQNNAVQSADENIQHASSFVLNLKDGAFDEATANFDMTMQEAMPPAKLQQTWETLQAQVGAFKEEISTRREQVQQYDVIFVTSQFENALIDIKIVFNQDHKIAGLFFVPATMQTEYEYEMPEYVDKDGFWEFDTLVGFGLWALPATVTVPEDDGPFPAVVLVHGSGPHDRDETIGPNKPFRDLAWGLASRGIVVLSYDKRTKVYPERMDSLKHEITVMDVTVNDALTAVGVLRNLEMVDPEQLYVLGHSLGGTMAPRIAKYYPRLSGLIILAGSIRPLEDLILEQSRYIFSLDENLSEAEKAHLKKIEAQVARVKSGSYSDSTMAEDLPLGIAAQFWQDLSAYDLKETVKKSNKPMLVLQGERDYQVTMEDFAGWRDLQKSKDNLILKNYPKLNHLFMRGEGKSRPEEYNQPGHVDGQVIIDIADWIKAQK